MVLLTVLHFSRQFMFSDGAATPFRFMEAILMFALSLFFFRFSVVDSSFWFVALSPGVGCVTLSWLQGSGTIPGGGPALGRIPAGFVYSCVWYYAWVGWVGWFRGMHLYISGELSWGVFGYVHSFLRVSRCM